MSRTLKRGQESGYIRTRQRAGSSWLSGRKPENRRKVVLWAPEKEPPEPVRQEISDLLDSRMFANMFTEEQMADIKRWLTFGHWR